MVLLVAASSVHSHRVKGTVRESSRKVLSQVPATFSYSPRVPLHPALGSTAAATPPQGLCAGLRPGREGRCPTGRHPTATRKRVSSGRKAVRARQGGAAKGGAAARRGRGSRRSRDGPGGGGCDGGGGSGRGVFSGTQCRMVLEAAAAVVAAALLAAAGGGAVAVAAPAGGIKWRISKS